MRKHNVGSAKNKTREHYDQSVILTRMVKIIGSIFHTLKEGHALIWKTMRLFIYLWLC